MKTKIIRNILSFISPVIPAVSLFLMFLPFCYVKTYQYTTVKDKYIYNGFQAIKDYKNIIAMIVMLGIMVLVSIAMIVFLLLKKDRRFSDQIFTCVGVGLAVSLVNGVFTLLLPFVNKTDYFAIPIVIGVLTLVQAGIYGLLIYLNLKVIFHKEDKVVKQIYDEKSAFQYIDTK